MTLPRVFSEGTLTVVIGLDSWPNSMQVYAGPHKLETLEGLKIDIHKTKTTGEILLPSSVGEDNEDLTVEQEERLLSMFKWIRVRR